MKILIVFMLLFSGCGYTISHQLLLAPETKTIGQDTEESKNKIEESYL